MQFIKLRSLELKHSTVSQFCVQSFGNNFVIGNPVTEAVILNMNNEPDKAELFPFTVTSVDVPQDRFATTLLKDIDLRQIYDKCSILEQQEFGLDPIFVAEACIEPAKPRLLQAQLQSSSSFSNPMLAIISTYGTCHILTRNSYNRLWDQKIVDLTIRLMSDVFPTEKLANEFSTFTELKDFISLYVCTAFAWHSCGNIIYLANASGYIIVFEIHEDVETKNIIFKFTSKIQAEIGRICYLKSFENYLIATSIDGVLKLFILNERCNEKISGGSMKALSTLWSQKDQMTCRQIVAEKCQIENAFTIFFAKGSHIICLRISNEGKIEGSSKLYVPGIKISGLEMFLENEVIVTTITGEIFHVTSTCVRENGYFKALNLNAKKVALLNSETDSFQILGVGSTLNKALWVFMTDRNKELPESIKTAVLPSNLILCRLNTVDPLAKLNEIHTDAMDSHHDLILALRLNVWQSSIFEKYDNRYSIFSKISQLDTFNETFLRNMQIHLEIARAAYRRSSYKLQIMNEILLSEIEFLELGAQIVHIQLRLEYLGVLMENKSSEITNDKSKRLTMLTEFQRRSVAAMRKNFYILIEKLKDSTNKTSINDAVNQLNEVVIEFIELALRNWNEKCKIYDAIDSHDLVEKCLFCNEPLNDQQLMCDQGHNISRCCVSYVQLPWLNNRHCAQCATMALETVNSKDMLSELFPPNESVTCTLCRFKFIKNDYF